MRGGFEILFHQVKLEEHWQGGKIRNDLVPTDTVHTSAPFFSYESYSVFKAVGTPVIWMKKWRLMRTKVLPAPSFSDLPHAG